MACPISASQVRRRARGGRVSLADLRREKNRVFDDLFCSGGALTNAPSAFAQAAAGATP